MSKKILKITNSEIKDSQTEEYNPESFTLKSFSNNTQIKILKKNSEEIIFDIIGIELH